MSTIPDGKVTISTALDNKGLQKGINGISGSMGGLNTVVKRLSATIATAFSVTKIIQFGAATSKAAMQVSDAMTGLQSIIEGQGRNFSKAKSFLDEYVKDGLIPMQNAAAAYKNLAMRGYDDSQIEQTMIALKNASAYGRQASLSMGEAVQSATEGLKNENSILVDNAGVTKNVSKMWDEYAASIGTTAAKLTQEQKIQAEANGILKESKYQTGDAAKVAGTLSGQLQQLSFNFKSLKVAVGNIVNPIVQAFLPAVNTAVTAVTKLANSIATVVSGIFGKAVTTTNLAAAATNDYASAENDLAKGIDKAGKAAKKATAGFDELNVLQTASGLSGDSTNATPSAGSTGGTSSYETNVEDTISPQFQKIVDKIKNIVEPLKSINLEPLRKAFKNLGKAIKKFSTEVGKALEWCWFNILAPLTEWTIKEAAPASVVALSDAFSGLTATVSVVFDALKWCWDSLQPIFSWIGDTALVILEDLKEIGQGIAKKWKENEPKIKQAFENIGTVIEKIWAVIGPILTWLRDGLSQIATDTPINDLQYIIDMFYGLSEILAGIFNLDLGQIFNGLSVSAEAELSRATESLRTYAKAMGIDTDALDEKIGSWARGVGEKFSSAWNSVKSIWGNVSAWFDENVIQPVKDIFEPIGAWFSDLWSSIEQTFSDAFYNIGAIAQGCWEVIKYAWDVASGWFDETVIQPVKKLFQPITDWLDQNIIQPVTGFFTDLWDGFSTGASDSWEKVQEVFSGIGKWGKDILNELIRALNSGLDKIIGGINSLLTKWRDFKVGDKQPFSNIKTISVPQIPYLAQGAVLPPNKPFMAVVGDQKHGTNIEAPLDTIKQALAEVMATQKLEIGGININFTGDLAQLARVLKPVIDNEDRRVGGSLIRKGAQ